MQTTLALLLSALPTILSAPTSAARGLSKRGYSGDITYYQTGLGSCGAPSADSDDIVALSVPMMANGANANSNPLCFQHITIAYGGQNFDATVVDTCQGCDYGSIDLSPGLFTKITGSLDAGRVHGVSWWFDDASGNRPGKRFEAEAISSGTVA